MKCCKESACLCNVLATDQCPVDRYVGRVPCSCIYMLCNQIASQCKQTEKVASLSLGLLACS